MKTHDVKEPITDNRLYIEIDPQPKAIADNYFHYGNIVCSLAALESEYCPISIGDTINGRKVMMIEIECRVYLEPKNGESGLCSPNEPKNKKWFWKYKLD